MKTAALISLLSLLPANARAFEPVFIAPGQALYDETSSRSVLSIAVGPYHDGTIEKLSVPGEVRSRSWRFSSGFSGTGSMAEEISAQLHKQGYDVLYSCGSLACGAFDFRFGIDVLLPPNMFVDLSDYFYLSATKDTPKGQAAVSALISRSAQAGLLQIMSAGPASFDDAGETQNGKGSEQISPETAPAHTKKTVREQAKPTDVASPTMQPTSVARQLDEVGHMVLDDLSFDTGSSTLSEGPFPSLEALAEFLKEDSSRRIVLVGHTDTLGSLDANIRLSQRRAASVRARLISAYGIKQSQMDARGAGYLAPVTSNATEAGRNRNRRVEVVLLEGQK